MADLLLASPDPARTFHPDDFSCADLPQRGLLYPVPGARTGANTFESRQARPEPFLLGYFGVQAPGKRSGLLMLLDVRASQAEGLVIARHSPALPTVR
jgi:hypothetical protein